MDPSIGYTLVIFFDVPTRPGTVTWHAEWYPDLTEAQVQERASQYTESGLWVSMPSEEGGKMEILIPWHHVRHAWVMPGQVGHHTIDNMAINLWRAVPIYPVERRPRLPQVGNQVDKDVPLN